jgi:predicted nucleotidyltransferase
MTICGIIAEYNPLHNGHAYHIRQARQLSGCDWLIAVMSGNFTQRGEPAIVDKWLRTRMALSCGVDLVLELPAGYAVQPAQWFARGGVGTLAGLGCVDTLAFGAESGTAQGFSRLASLLAEEPPQLQQLIREGLGRGLLHPAARAAAVEAYLRQMGEPALADEAAVLLASPNNILGWNTPRPWPFAGHR